MLPGLRKKKNKKSPSHPQNFIFTEDVKATINFLNEAHSITFVKKNNALLFYPLTTPILLHRDEKIATT